MCSDAKLFVKCIVVKAFTYLCYYLYAYYLFLYMWIIQWKVRVVLMLIENGNACWRIGYGTVWCYLVGHFECLSVERHFNESEQVCTAIQTRRKCGFMSFLCALLQQTLFKMVNWPIVFTANHVTISFNLVSRHKISMCEVILFFYSSYFCFFWHRKVHISCFTGFRWHLCHQRVEKGTGGRADHILISLALTGPLSIPGLTLPASHTSLEICLAANMLWKALICYLGRSSMHQDNEPYLISLCSLMSQLKGLVLALAMWLAERIVCRLVNMGLWRSWSTSKILVLFHRRSCTRTLAYWLPLTIPCQMAGVPCNGW